jgi:hypothetical protein
MCGIVISSEGGGPALIDSWARWIELFSDCQNLVVDSCTQDVFADSLLVKNLTSAFWHDKPGKDTRTEVIANAH